MMMDLESLERFKINVIDEDLSNDFLIALLLSR